MITINIDKAKTIAHDMRRAQREKEFAPLDEIIMKRIPGHDAEQAEAQRQAVRDKYAAMQEEIESAQTVDALKEALGLPNTTA